LIIPTKHILYCTHENDMTLFKLFNTQCTSLHKYKMTVPTANISLNTRCTSKHDPITTV